MKRALVLAGGGSKGAYEAGFLRALQEENLSFDIVVGTSIGALNGCLLAQGSAELLQDLWKTIDINNVFAIDSSNKIPTYDVDSYLNNSNLVYSFFMKYLKEKGSDITPLKNLIKKLLDEDKLFSSPIDFGLCTVSFPSLKPLYISKKEMGRGNIYDYLLATSAAFPAFPIHTFKGKSYVDGSFYDNVPIDLAFNLGADEVLVVDMKTQATHPYYLNKPDVIYTHPNVDLGGFLDFSRQQLNRNTRIGYQTGLKAFHHLEGIQYSFYPYDSTLFDAFYQDVVSLERKMRFESHFTDDFLLSKIRNDYDFVFTKKDYLYGVMDWLGEIAEKEVSIVYDFEDFSQIILAGYKKYRSASYKMIETDALMKNFKDINKKGRVGRIFHQLLYPQDELMKLETFVQLFPKETLMAKLLFYLTRI